MNVNQQKIEDINFSNLEISSFWSSSSSRELKMHKIHAYPAKFPAFLVGRAIEYSNSKCKAHKIDTIGDIFCGCGTTALESSLNNVDFVGFDINPVATLIARVKSKRYDIKKLKRIFEDILSQYSKQNTITPNRIYFNERINYWFEEPQIRKLYRLLNSINSIPSQKYREFFLVAFSNILKPTSRWLTKSIKPQIDPDKVSSDVIEAFCKQVNFMLKASAELVKNYSINKRKPVSKIENKNFLKTKSKNCVDLIITSPPYVTSYEYADLHQLSSLWLGFTSDYRDLRKGSIGSIHNITEKEKGNELNNVGKGIISELNQYDRKRSKSVSKYFVDLSTSIKRSYEFLRPGGRVVFVIGNTQYKGVEVNNAAYLLECLNQNGFEDLEIFKRKITGKILTPYRDEKGRFKGSKTSKEIYDVEFIISASKSQD